VTTAIDLRRGLGLPEDISGGIFGTGRRLTRAHPLLADSFLALLLIAISTVWLVGSRVNTFGMAVLQVALIAPLALRRVHPLAVFAVVSALGLVQWLLGDPLLGDVAMLGALYTVAAHEARVKAACAAIVLEVGAVMASVKWDPAGTLPRSLLFLTATVIAALFAGRTVASGSRYLDWLDERTRRLEIERDQQATIAAAAERTRIARELHDIVSHSLSVVITLADAAALVSQTDTRRGIDTMAKVSDVGRQALADMRSMLDVLRIEVPLEMVPQPGIADIPDLLERVRTTGIQVDYVVEDNAHSLGPAIQLTTYRVVQEALTNIIRHAAAQHAWVSVLCDQSSLRIRVLDDGTALPDAHGPGHGILGMRERVALHHGQLIAAPAPHGGWLVEAVLPQDRVPNQGRAE